MCRLNEWMNAPDAVNELMNEWMNKWMNMTINPFMVNCGYTYILQHCVVKSGELLMGFSWKRTAQIHDYTDSQLHRFMITQIHDYDRSFVSQYQSVSSALGSSIPPGTMKHPPCLRKFSSLSGKKFRMWHFSPFHPTKFLMTFFSPWLKILKFDMNFVFLSAKISDDPF